MRRRVFLKFLSLIAAGALSAAARADDWTGPKEVAGSAHEFAVAADTLGKAIKDVDEDSPLVKEVQTLAKSAAKLHDSVAKGAGYDDAKRDFGKLEGGYTHFEAGLKGAHEVHHEKPVAEAAKKVTATFGRLRDHMAGRRPSEKTDPSHPKTTRENLR